ncbi:hypothetical protein FQN57_001768 [Myotisia sp. PD_48]|nr:hypothetical protein FQN57_001768 [Myotisia sp. PD_48]
MTLSRRTFTGPHAPDTTYISTAYTRGLLGVDVPLDHLLTLIICVSIGAVCVGILLVRCVQRSHAHLRRITSATSSPNEQRFWGVEDWPFWGDIKKHVLYAPIGRKRHNREIKLSEAINVGTLPSRFHTILLSLYCSSQVAYCAILDYDVNNKAALVAELRGRSGNLAVLNMIPLVVLAGRNNPLIPLLGVSFDTYNLYHRWLGRLVSLETVAHTIAWMINAHDAGGWDHTWMSIWTEKFFTWGFIATIAAIVLLLHSVSPIRHAFYETFLHLHQLAAVVIILGIYMHLHIDGLPQLPWFQFIIAFWATERAVRFLRLLYLNIARRHGMTKTVVKALPGEACLVTFSLPRRATIPAGSHVYVYFPRISLWMSHPFSVAWAEDGTDALPKSPRPDVSRSQSQFTASPISSSSSPTDIEKQHNDNDNSFLADRQQPTTVSVIIAVRTGMTKKLYNAALASPNSTLQTTGFIEGPYKSHPSSFGSYGTVVLFSGGAGITHHMMHVRDLLNSAAAGTVATRKIYLIWAVRSTEHLAWVRGFMDSILHLPNRRDILTTKLFISKPRSQREIASPSSTLQMFPGRCKPDVVMEEALADHVGATAVSVCGSGAFSDEVRAAVRKRIGNGLVIDFVEESFTW